MHAVVGAAVRPIPIGDVFEERLERRTRSRVAGRFRNG